MKDERPFPSRLPALRYVSRRPKTDASSTINEALAILDRRLSKRERTFRSPTDTRSFLRLKLEALEQEVFAALFLDNRHRLIHYEELFFGTIDRAAVYPREVVKKALKYNAAAVIFAHNHPSGVAEPSEADRSLTLRLREALGFVDIRVLDHIVVGMSEQVSLAERGWL